ncbi:MAG: hypothetical protein NC388_00345 [Clostridium sp.]|nr:hypothetical protein [Clostridium sp.]
MKKVIYMTPSMTIVDMEIENAIMGASQFDNNIGGGDGDEDGGEENYSIGWQSGIWDEE